MNKTLILVGGISITVITALAVVGYVAIKQDWFNLEDNNDADTENSLDTPNVTGPCTPDSIDLEGYTEKGKRLANCFVEYPGEPSREDKSYYIVEDICGQFTQEFMESMSGQTFVQIKAPIIEALYNCTYFINTEDGLTGNYILVQLEYLSVENQKTGHEVLGRTVTIDNTIPMNNYVVYQEDGVINSILLILSNNKFLRIDRSSTVVSDEALKSTAINIADEIKEYK